MPQLQSAFGLFVLVLIAWLASTSRRRFPWRIAVAGVLLQAAIATLMFKLTFVRAFFLALERIVVSLEEATMAGTTFVFGYLGGGPLPFQELAPGGSYVFAMRALPMVILIAALTSLLYYWRILPQVVRGFSFVLRKGMGIGGALGVGSSATIFLGLVEGPLLIRPYLPGMTRSELFSMMSCGMACIAGTVLVLYADLLQNVIPDSIGHVLTASIIHAPAALLIAAVMVPEQQPQTMGDALPASAATGAMDAVTKGTVDGMHLLINMVAMLIALIALVKLVNLGLGLLPDMAGEPLSLERIMGLVMSPLVWLMGVPWAEARTAGMLMGAKTMLNEFIAYIQMSKLPAGSLSPRSSLIMTYAMCGFANFGSLGILIGGFGSMCPERREEVVAMGLRAILAGTLASSMTGALVGILY